jgi:hypothetical protein
VAKLRTIPLWAFEIIQMLGTAYCLRRDIYQIFLRELQSLPTDSNDIPVWIPAHVDIAVLFFLGGTGILYGWTQCGHIFYLVKIDINTDSHNVRKSGQQYCWRGVWGRTGILVHEHVSSFSIFLKNTTESKIKLRLNKLTHGLQCSKQARLPAWPSPQQEPQAERIRTYFAKDCACRGGTLSSCPRA